MATVSELQAQLKDEQMKLNILYAPVNNGYGGAAYMNQLIRVERLQGALNKALKAEGD